MTNRTLKHLFELEDFDLSDNPTAPNYEFEIGEKVMKVVDFEYIESSRLTKWHLRFVGSVRVRVKNIDELMKKHDSSHTSLYNLNFISTSPYYRDHETNDNAIVTNPWYLVEYPRAEDFEQVKMEWIPESELSSVEHLIKEEEDFNLSDNPLHDSTSFRSVLKDNNYRVSFQMFVGTVDNGVDVGWESVLAIKQSRDVEYVVTLDFNFEGTEKPTAENLKPIRAEVNDIEDQKRDLTQNEITTLLQNPKILNIIRKHRSRAKSEVKGRVEKRRSRGLNEYISRDEATTDVNSVKTVADGKRGIAFITVAGNSEEDLEAIEKMIQNHGLKAMFVRSQSNTNEPYVVYAPGHEKQANELKDIAEKYNGYLHKDATEEDTRRIGELLEYEPQEIEDFITKNYKTDLKEFFNLKEEEDDNFDLSDNPLIGLNYVTAEKLYHYDNTIYEGWRFNCSQDTINPFWVRKIDNPNYLYGTRFFLTTRILETDYLWGDEQKEGVKFTLNIVTTHTTSFEKIKKPWIVEGLVSGRDYMNYSKKVIDEINAEIDRGDYDEYFADDVKGLQGISEEEEEDFDLSDNPIHGNPKISDFGDLNGQELNGWKISTRVRESAYSSRYDEYSPAKLEIQFRKEIEDPENEPRLTLMFDWELEGDEYEELEFGEGNGLRPIITYDIYFPKNLSPSHHLRSGFYSSLPMSQPDKEITTITQFKREALKQMAYFEEKVQEKIKENKRR